MPEPTSTTSAGAGLAALAIALLGPLAGWPRGSIRQFVQANPGALDISRLRLAAL